VEFVKDGNLNVYQESELLAEGSQGSVSIYNALLVSVLVQRGVGEASTCYGFQQVVDADRSLGGFCGFWIDAVVVEITKVGSFDDALIARQCD